MIRTLIVGQNNSYTQCVHALLDTELRIDVIGNVATSSDAVEFCAKQSPDVALFLYELHYSDITVFIKTLQKNRIDTKIVVFGRNIPVENVVRLINSGVSGFFLTTTQIQEIPGVIYKIVKGNKFIPLQLRETVMERLLNVSDSRISSLSNREYQILVSLANAKNIREISAEIGISPRTVESHKANIMKKMGLKNIAELVHAAIKEGVVGVKDNSIM